MAVRSFVAAMMFAAVAFLWYGYLPVSNLNYFLNVIALYV
jgi:hypothetical protein